jgi:hypothetical protein
MIWKSFGLMNQARGEQGLQTSVLPEVVEQKQFTAVSQVPNFSQFPSRSAWGAKFYQYEL